MKRTCKIPLIALLLLLAFSQKLGVVVLMHSKFHTSAQPSNTGNTTGYYQIQCDCLDEALAPLAKPDGFVLALPEKRYFEPTTTPFISFPSPLKIYHSLRAPPAVA